MKLWLVVTLSLVLGIVAGVGGTMIELGARPGGSVGVEDPLGLGHADVGPRPRVVVDEPEYDFGTMHYGATEKHTFVVRNQGDGPLSLEQLSTTCKCTLGKLGEEEIPPGGSTDVSLEWTANTSVGPFRQSATIQTNDPARPRLTLTVVGRVIRAYELSPERLVLANMTTDSSETQEVRLFSTVTDDLAVEEVEFEKEELKEFFDVKVGKPLPKSELSEDAKSGVPIQVTVKSGLPLEPFRQTIRLRTNMPESPVVELPVEGTVRGDILIVGPGWSSELNRLSLGRGGVVSSGEGYTADLTLIVRGPHQDGVRIEPVSVRPDLLEVSVGEPAKLGNVTRVPLRVRVPAGAPVVNHSGTELGDYGEIVLKTGHPQTEEVRMKVRFIVER